MKGRHDHEGWPDFEVKLRKPVTSTGKEKLQNRKYYDALTPLKLDKRRSRGISFFFRDFHLKHLLQ